MIGMFGQEAPATGPDWGIVVPPDQAAPAPASGGLFSQLPTLFQNFEQARIANAYTNASVQQAYQLSQINPAWIIAGVFVVLLAFARR
jgi:hypothetical protein